MIVEEDIGGDSLAMILARGDIDIVTALTIAIRIADILGRIHQRQVIHKDMNPSNVIWNRATDELRLIDFGISSHLTEERQEFQNVNQIEGTLAYISPEQTGRVNRKLDYRSDLYSLGVSLYQLFTGTLPFTAREGIELVHAHIALPPTPPHVVNPAIPPILSEIILRLMAKMAEERYQSAWGLKHDLEVCYDHLVESGFVVGFPLARNDVSPDFRLPQKLYGRENEIAAILSAFDRAAAGKSELLMVSGFSGIGKSALVHEVHKPLTERHGNFIAGKFDQYQRDVPFHAWKQAFEQFCSLLLKEDESTLSQWRARIATAVGGIGKAIIDIIPSIEMIIGIQPEVPSLAGEQAMNRLNYVFGRFLGTVCRPEHPLVVFIDDWQWADPGSLSLLKSLMAGKELCHLLIIVAYRDNEVYPAHPLMQALDEIRKAGTEIDDIPLSGLRRHDVRALIGDALNHPPGLDRISGLVFEKTRGNAFFLVQLLEDLYEKSAIVFSPEHRQWTWREEEIESRKVADNVVDLMSEKIRNLPDESIRSLVHAACIGDRFELGTLAAILRQPAHRVAEVVEAALREGILIPIGLGYRVARQESNQVEAHYQFIHDRVRQAAYSLLDTETAEKTHYEIATCWLAGCAAEELEHRIFDIANQYNAGMRHLADPGQKRILLEINLRAGKRAKNATAHLTAMHYFRKALELRSEDCWETDPRGSAELNLLAAEVAFLGKDYEAMEQWLDEYLGRVNAPLERVAALKIRLQAYVAQNRLSEAVDVALHALSFLSVKLPKAPNALQVMGGLLRTKMMLRGKKSEDLLSLPAMTDPVKLAVMDLLGLALPPAYWTSQELLALVVFQMVRESIAHGHSPNAGYGFSWWGITECAMLGNIDAGCEFGEFAIELAQRHSLKLQMPLFFSAWIILKFKRPLRETIPLFERTYSLSLEIGDFEYASYARNNHMQALFHCGLNLSELLQEMDRAHRDLERFKLGSSLYWHDIWWQTARNFVYPSDDPQRLAGPAYDEAVSLSQHLKVNDISTLFLMYFAKLLLSCFFNDRENAPANAKKAKAYLKGGVGMHAHVLFHSYESLALLIGKTGNLDAERKAILRRVSANQKKLDRWAAHSPENYRHYWLLVEAERLRVMDDYEGALKYYDQAIDHARNNGFSHDEAFAHELAARCHIQKGRGRLATYYLREALQLYERWGAAVKSTRLKAEFPELLLTVVQPGDDQGTTDRKRSPRSPRSGSDPHDTGAFDVAAITQASQAISGEIVLDKLITTLLKLVVEHAGAQKALLILRDNGGFSIQARGTVGQVIKVDLTPIPLGDDGGDDSPLPRSLIQYVGRTFKSQVIQDARLETAFSRDPYFQRERPLSVLCEPIIRQGNLIGMLYLENNLTAGAFTEERLELLRLLSSQAAISIENANLYRLLEQKVEERTQKLQASLEAQELLNVELQTSSRQLAEANAQLREAQALLQQQADSDGLTGLANRRYFNDRLRYELDRCARDGQPLALIMCDLDNFKLFNDTYGHVAGDECLCQTSRAMQSVFNRSTDLVARYGGEEFVVLLPMTTADQAAALGEIMRQAVADLAIPHGQNGRLGVVTVSAGCCAVVPMAFTLLEDVVGKADMALYQAKQAGRNRLVLL